MVLSGQASTEMEAEHARSGLGMVMTRQDHTAPLAEAEAIGGNTPAGQGQHCSVLRIRAGEPDHH
jgi:hypothetical protein